MWRGGKVLIVVAHPDDETLAFGGEMEHWPDCVVVHTTNGSPADLIDAHIAGFATQAEYAAARRTELQCALAQVGCRPTHCLNYFDKDSLNHLPAITRDIQKLIEQTRPEAILTHPFEGGHPDHDSASFSVQCACELIGPNAPVRIEGAFYNASEGRFQTNTFLPGPPETAIPLSGDIEARKRRMFACFTSQKSVLQAFTTDIERYRNAPTYDFQIPPHSGTLSYETYGWGLHFSDWQQRAASARRELFGAAPS